MAIRALDLSHQVRHVCDGDDPEDPTTFILGTLSSRDKGAIKDSVTSFSFSDSDIEDASNKKAGKENSGGSVDTKVERSKMNFEAVRRGLKGWENFLDSKGDLVPFKLVTRDVGGGVKLSVVPNELLAIIPLEVVEELADKIMGGMSEDEGEDGKNSQGQSTDGSSTPTDDATIVD